MDRRQLLFFIGLFVYAVGGRMLLLYWPNVETIMAASIIGAALLGQPWGLLIGVLSVATTDIWIGNTSILLFTWSAWALIGGFGKTKRPESLPSWALGLTGRGLLGVAFFFLWTNFGVWLTSGMYPPTLTGLGWSYLMGLPFLKYHLISTVLLLPISSFAFGWADQRFSQRVESRYDPQAKALEQPRKVGI